MKALVFGSNGQLGKALINGNFPGWIFSGLNRKNCDVSNELAVRRALQENDCDVVINAAAYTAVDKAESEADLAGIINGEAPGWMADECAASGKSFVHISSDFVFGQGHSKPILVDAPTSPLNVYGESKLAGEKAVQSAMKNALTIRTSWVYAATGNNFMNTMLRLMKEREELGVVDDQIGTPTTVRDLAEAIISLAEAKAHGIYHSTNSGVASWYDFAVAISEEAYSLGLLPSMIRINAIPTTAFPTPAIRPHYSVLDKEATWQTLDKVAPHWREALRRTLLEIDHNA
jgi:dTDP-4-dehydrorhamnose reductase